MQHEEKNILKQHGVKDMLKIDLRIISRGEFIGGSVFFYDLCAESGFIIKSHTCSKHD